MTRAEARARVLLDVLDRRERTPGPHDDTTKAGDLREWDEVDAMIARLFALAASPARTGATRAPRHEALATTDRRLG
jgi:hypothetical protein